MQLKLTGNAVQACLTPPDRKEALDWLCGAGERRTTWWPRQRARISTDAKLSPL
jgi:hypothetical protein